MEDEEGVFWPREGSYGACKSIVMKGKRTKRQRSQFPCLFEVNNGNNSGYEDEDRPNAGSRGSDCEKEYDVVKLSPGSSSEQIEEDGVVGVDQEEEDMARCLILLSQGRSRGLGTGANYRDSPNHHRRGSFDQEDQKFNSKRYLEATAGAGKIGYFVYECKTCNRTFPSFQALGGHRASHYKKPKVVVAEDKKPSVPQFSMTDNDDEASAPRFTRNGNGSMPSSAFYLQLSSTKNFYGVRSKYNNDNNSKVHECGICGVEFSSGQALGGHMRRHRGPTGASPVFSSTPATGASPVFSSTPATTTDYEEPPMRVRSLLSLDLDLNLPAPEAIVDRNNNVLQANNNEAPPQPKQQQGQQDQPRLVFSVPALVDCHY